MANKMKKVAKRFGVLEAADERRKLKDLDTGVKATKVKGGLSIKSEADVHGCPACPHPGFKNYHTASRT